MPSTRSTDRDLAAAALLADATRRRLYELVASSGEPVTRDAAAAALDIGRALATFHLERLAAAGLLSSDYRRVGVRRGPGGGRPAKRYRLASGVEVSLPPRRYALLGRLLSEALASTDPRAGLRGGAQRTGQQLGQRARSGAPHGATDLLAQAASALAAEGFAPRVEADGTLRLTNCPFEAVAAEQRPLICGELNRGLIEGFAEGLGRGRLVASLEPQEGGCCMALRGA